MPQSTKCKGCGASWMSATQMHCSADGCHNHFKNEAAFVAHLDGKTHKLAGLEPEHLRGASVPVWGLVA